MANTGNLFPGTGENNNGIGATPWTNPGNVISDNTTDATCNAAASSQYLVSRNFALSTIPVNATIDGIIVRIEASEHTTGTESLNTQLRNARGVLIGSSKAQTISGTAKAVYTYGATNDVWGATLTPTILHNANFGFNSWFTTAHDVRIDYTTIQVEYTLATHGLATETDTASALTLSKSLTTSVATETDTALALVLSKQCSIGIATETNTALGQTFSKQLTTSVATETNTASTLSFSKQFATGLATETDTALTLTLTSGGSGPTAIMQVKSGGVFGLQPTMVKIGGVFTEKQAKIKIGGVFV